MADPRRSARSTKGVNSRLSDSQVEAPSPAPAKKRKSTPKRNTPAQNEPDTEPEGDGEGKPDDIIRCVCGATDDSDGKMMIQCEQCDAWQHTACMGIPKKNIPDKYFCELCKPEEHEVLLASMGRGEKPWEKKGGRRRRTGPKESTPTTAEKGVLSSRTRGSHKASTPAVLEVSLDRNVLNVVAEDKMDIDPAGPQEEEQKNGEDKSEDKMDYEHTAPESSPPIAPTETQPPVSSEGSTSKPLEQSPPAPKAAKRKASVEAVDELKTEEKKDHSDKKQRKGSVVVQEATPRQDRRKSLAASKPTPLVAKGLKEDITPQKELVDAISELRNTTRQKAVTYLLGGISEHAKRLFGEGTLELPAETTVESLSETRALQIEHQVYLNHFSGGQIVPDYQKRARTIGYNLKSNPALSEEFLMARLSAERLSLMTTEEMANKELKELTQQVRLESEKHNTLINETGPRIRRTHKGEELVGEESNTQSGQDTLLESGTVIRRPTEEIATRVSAGPESPAQPLETSMSPTTNPAASEPPRSPSGQPPAPIEAVVKAPSVEKNRSFSIENVWSHVESPDNERRPLRTPTHMPASARPADNKVDRDIDMLLKDDDQEPGTPPYSPGSLNDHYSPKPYQDEGVVWRGELEMNQIASLNAIATILGGPETIGDKPWVELLDTVLTIDGRIKHDRATEYLCGQKFSRSSTMVLASLSPENSNHQTQFDILFEYFKSKERYAVVGRRNEPCVKDLYVVPIEPNETLPDWFNVVDPPSKVPEKGRSSRMLVLIFVVIKSLVPGHVDSPVTSAAARRFSAPAAGTQSFGTPRQPQASPYVPPQSSAQPQYQASQQQHGLPPPQPPAGSSGPLPSLPYSGQHSPVQYGYPPQQPHVQYSQQPQSQPQPLPALQPHSPHGYPPQTLHHSPQPSPRNAANHQSPPPYPQGPGQQSQAAGQQSQAALYVPKHPMTLELLKIVPGLNEKQARTIDKLLEENPELQTKPDVLAKEVEKVLSVAL